MQVAVVPLRQFPPLPPALAPDMKRFPIWAKKPELMMIYHRLV